MEKIFNYLKKAKYEFSFSLVLVILFAIIQMITISKNNKIIGETKNENSKLVMLNEKLTLENKTIKEINIKNNIVTVKTSDGKTIKRKLNKGADITIKSDEIELSLEEETNINIISEDSILKTTTITMRNYGFRYIPQFSVGINNDLNSCFGLRNSFIFINKFDLAQDILAINEDEKIKLYLGLSVSCEIPYLNSVRLGSSFGFKNLKEKTVIVLASVDLK